MLRDDGEIVSDVMLRFFASLATCRSNVRPTPLCRCEAVTTTGSTSPTGTTTLRVTGLGQVAVPCRRVTHDAIADLSAVVTRIEPRLREICGDTVRLTLASEPRLPAVQFDPKELERAILALATHSREALGETGGAIAIRVARNSAAGGLTLTVTDDRKWPPAAVGPQMFEP